MALFYHFEVSVGTTYSPPSLLSSAFVPVGAPVADTGNGATFDHTAINPGVLYAYRARRFDDSTGVFSPYSPVAFARAPYPEQEPFMQEGILDSVITGAKVVVGIGLEAREGFAVRAQKLLEVESQSIRTMLESLYANTLINKPTMRNKLAPGMGKVEGSLTALVTPEGGFLILLQALLASTVTGASSPFTHTFRNLFGSKSVTLTVIIGNFLFVVSGVRCTSLQFNNLVAEATAIVNAVAEVAALNMVWYDLTTNPGAVAATGMDTAGADTLDAYSGVHMQSWIGGYFGTVKSANITVKPDMIGKKGANGKRGYSAHYAAKTDITVSADVYFEDLTLIRRDYGVADNTPTPFGPSMSVVHVPFSLMLAPPNNAAGFSNILRFELPDAELDAPIEVGDDKEVGQTVTFSSLNLAGNSAGTDFLMSFANSVSAAAIAPGVPIAEMPMTALTWYFSTGVAAAPAPTTTVFTTNTLNLASLSQVVNDPIYLAREVYFLTGANANVSRKITAYAPPSGGNGAQFTVATAFGSAPATGDQFTVA